MQHMPTKNQVWSCSSAQVMRPADDSHNLPVRRSRVHDCPVTSSQQCSIAPVPVRASAPVSTLGHEIVRIGAIYQKRSVQAPNNLTACLLMSAKWSSKSCSWWWTPSPWQFKNSLATPVASTLQLLLATWFLLVPLTYICHQ